MLLDIEASPASAQREAATGRPRVPSSAGAAVAGPVHDLGDKAADLAYAVLISSQPLATKSSI